MKLRKTILAFAVAAFTVFTGCSNQGDTVQTTGPSKQTDSTGKQTSTGDKQKDELFPIKTATRYDCTLAPYIVADTKGFFADEGLELVFTGELASGETIPSVISGVNDFADAHPNQLAANVYGGAKVKAVGRSIIEPDPDEIGDTEHRLLHMWYFVNPDSGITSIEQLKDYKSGTKIKSAGYENTCETFILNNIFDVKGVSRDRFEWVNLESDTAKIEALKLGQVDIIGVHPPFYNAAIEAGLVKIADSWEAGLGEATGVYLYYFSDDFISKHPDEVAAFVRAMTKAQQWANANKEETNKLVEDFIGQPVQGNHYYSETTVIDEETIKPWLDDLIKGGVIPEGGLEITDFITHQFEQG